MESTIMELYRVDCLEGMDKNMETTFMGFTATNDKDPFLHSWLTRGQIKASADYQGSWRGRADAHAFAVQGLGFRHVFKGLF